MTETKLIWTEYFHLNVTTPSKLTVKTRLLLLWENWRMKSVVSLWFNNKLRQDGPSLESSSYLNLSLRYLDPWDPWTLEPLYFSYFPLHPHTSYYLCLLLSSFGMFFFGGGVWVMSCDIWQWDWRWTFDLYMDPLGPPPSFYILFL